MTLGMIDGGPTDVSFSDSHKEFKDFVKIQQEVSNVVETVHEIL